MFELRPNEFDQNIRLIDLQFRYFRRRLTLTEVKSIDFSLKFLVFVDLVEDQLPLIRLLKKKRKRTNNVRRVLSFDFVLTDDERSSIYIVEIRLANQFFFTFVYQDQKEKFFSQFFSSFMSIDDFQISSHRLVVVFCFCFDFR